MRATLDFVRPTKKINLERRALGERTSGLDRGEFPRMMKKIMGTTYRDEGGKSVLQHTTWYL